MGADLMGMALRLQGRKPRVLSLLIAAATATATALLTSGCPGSPEQIQVPLSGWPSYEYFYLASKTGLDRKEGLAITNVQLPDPQAVINGYLREQFAVAQLSSVELLDLCNRTPSRCPAVVLVLDESSGGDQLAVHNSVASIEALRGQKVAVTFSSLGPYVLQLALQRHGLTLNDVQLVNMPLERMPEALQRREVMAAALYPPFSEMVTRKGVSRPLFSSQETPGEILDLLVVDPRELERNPQRISRLVRVWQQAHALAQSDPAAAIAVMAQREGLTPKEFAKAEGGLRYFSLEEQRKLLAPNGPVVRNLAHVHSVQTALGLSPKGSVMPQVSDRAVQDALKP